MSPLFDKLRGALRDARSARSSGSVDAERSPRSDGAERSPGSERTERSPRSERAERSLRSGGERSDPARHEGSSTAVVFQAAAFLLAYPEADLFDRLDIIESALAGTPAAAGFGPVLNHLRSQPLRAAQSFHVQEFDLSRRHAMHLSYWTDGDTRRRGEVLAEIKGVYRDSGLLGDLKGELPDYLPIMLEFAVADSDRGEGLLQRFRASLELLRIGLAEDHLPHAGVLTAICDCLPGESPKSRVEVQAMVDEVAPLEFVGLNEVVRR